MTLQELSAVFAGAAIARVEEEIAMREALTRAAASIQAEARREIGNYQGPAGPFAAWQRLTDNTLQGFDIGGRHIPGKEELGYAPPDNPLLREGTLRDHIQIAVRGNEAAIGVPSEIISSAYDGRPRDIGDIAIWHELGTSTEPPRSFLGGAAFRQADRVANIVGEGVVFSLFARRWRP